MIKDYFRKRVKDPVIALLRQGMSPSKLALSLAMGITLGVFPVLGVTTILCVALAMTFRLNHPAILVANWAVYPLQIVLMPPLFIAGKHLFGAGPLVHAPTRAAPLVTSSLVHGAGFLAHSTLHAILAWCVAAPFAVVILHFSLLPLLRRLARTPEKP
jgi:hypothetical protein